MGPSPFSLSFLQRIIIRAHVVDQLDLGHDQMKAQPINMPRDEPGLSPIGPEPKWGFYLFYPFNNKITIIPRLL